MSLEWWVAIGVGGAIILGAVLSRILAARRLSKHLDGMQAAEAAKAAARRHDRESPGA
jgi:type VI protein secretion system component VasK